MNIEERLAEVKARWQVFLNTMNVPYLEPLIGGTSLFPGFYLLWQDAFLLVDHEDATHLDRERKLARLSGKAVFTLTRPPVVLTWGKVGYDRTAVVVYPSKRGDNYYLWCECPHCGRCELQSEGRVDRLGCRCKKPARGKARYNFDSPRLQEAYALAAECPDFDRRQVQWLMEWC